MERIGDQAADIADIVKVTSLDVPDASIRLKDMAKATASMVQNASMHTLSRI